MTKNEIKEFKKMVGILIGLAIITAMVVGSNKATNSMIEENRRKINEVNLQLNDLSSDIHETRELLEDVKQEITQ